jgi:putative DNA primase/helicase
MAEAKAALALLTELLDGFEFKSEIDRAVALSLLLTVVTRASLPTAPLHLVRATSAGTGKSFLVDVAAALATGRICPVTTAGKTPEETEKKLGAMLREGMPIIALDNCTYDLEGDMLCQIAERPRVSIRILGVSEVVEFECRAAVVATGNNIGPKGDMNRRTLTCNLVADVERPELRDFAFDPLERVLADRGAYLRAVFTIIRAYSAAGAPMVCRPLGSYTHWTAMVRAPLIWLGEADPIESMEMMREEDPELTAMRELFAQWRRHLPEGSLTALQIADTAGTLDPDRKPVHPEFRDLLLRLAGDKGTISTKRLGAWLRRIQGKVLGGLRLISIPGRAGGHAPKFHLQADVAEKAQESTAPEETDTSFQDVW